MSEDNEIAGLATPTFHPSGDFEFLIPDMDVLKRVMAAYDFPNVPAATSETALLRTLLFYVCSNHGSRFATAWAVTAGLFEHLSHVWLLKCLRDAARFFRAYTKLLIRGFPPPTPIKDGWVVMMADATCIRSPQGPKDRYERIQMMWELKTGWIRHLFCPLDRRPGESIRRYLIQKNTLYVGDRLFCSGKAFWHVKSRRAGLLTRWSRNQGLWEVEGKVRFDWKKACRDLKVGERRSHPVRLGQGHRSLVVRLVVCHVGEDFGAKEREYIREKKGKVSADGVFASPYLILLSNAPESVFSDEELVSLYRLRWRGTETEIRELKSGWGLDAVVGRRVGTRRGWLWGHLCGQILWQRFDARVSSLSASSSAPSLSWDLSWVRNGGWYLKQAGREMLLRACISVSLRQWPEVRQRFLNAFRKQIWRKKKSRAFEAFLRTVRIEFDASIWRNDDEHGT